MRSMAHYGVLVQSSSFCEQFMLIMEAAKREMDCTNPLPNRRTGRRRVGDYVQPTLLLTFIFLDARANCNVNFVMSQY